MRLMLLCILVLGNSLWCMAQWSTGHWHIADANKQVPVEAPLTVEVAGEFKPLQFEPSFNHHCPIEFQGHAHLMILQPGYMLHSSMSQVPFSGVDTLLLRPLSVGVEQPLVHVDFVGDSFRLDAHSLLTLQQLTKFMNMHSNVELVIRGLHKNEADLNCERAGRQRARSVWEYLVTEGIDPGRLQLEGRCREHLAEPPIEIAISSM